MAEVQKPRSARPSTEIADDMAVSHGRGGIGNIGADDTPYGDGAIVRQGYEGESAANFSTGRGGGGNIGAGPAGRKSLDRKDDEIVPEEATRPSQEGNVHVGRGGAGNVADGETGDLPTHKGLADKLKDLLFKRKAKAPKTAPEAETAEPATTTA